MVDGEYLLGTELFTGIAFEPLASKENFYKAYRYLEGVKMGEYINKYWPQNKSYDYFDGNSVGLDEYLEEPEESLLLSYCGKKIISGAVCVFQNNTCERELLYENCEIVSDVLWSCSGELCWLILKSNENLYEEYEWASNGKLLEFIVSQNSFEAKLGFSMKFRLQNMVLQKGYFERLTNYYDKLKFLIIKNKEFAKNLTADWSLYLEGLDVDDEVFSHLQFSNGLTEVSKLFINGTSLSSQAIISLVKIKNLKSLSVRSKKDLLPTLIQFQHARPDCVTRFNNEFIRV